MQTRAGQRVSSLFLASLNYLQVVLSHGVERQTLLGANMVLTPTAEILPDTRSLTADIGHRICLRMTGDALNSTAG